MAAGSYCDITRYDFADGNCYIANTLTETVDAITVTASGTIENMQLASGDAFAIYSGTQIIETPTAVTTLSGYTNNPSVATFVLIVVMTLTSVLAVQHDWRRNR